MLISFIKLHETSQEYSPQCVEAFGVLIIFKMAAVAMVTKVQFFLNLFLTSRNFTVMFLVTCRFANRDIKFQNGCSQLGWGDVRYCFAMAILVIYYVFVRASDIHIHHLFDMLSFTQIIRCPYYCRHIILSSYSRIRLLD